MRLDHLLSREPCCGAAWPLVLVLRLVRGVGAGGGAWGRVGSAGSVLVGRVLVVGLGMGALLLWADGRAVGFTSNTRGPPFGVLPPPPLVGGRGPPLGGAAASCFGGGCVGFGPSAGILPSLGVVVVVVGCL